MLIERTGPGFAATALRCTALVMIDFVAMVGEKAFICLSIDEEKKFVWNVATKVSQLNFVVVEYLFAVQ